ncbi:hypothetical protein, partial [Pseudomonas syringae]|uniref:hypothetical protein n=1 Tax=Pseudomonas syringae TaxID=317 RepID=UPI0034D95272
LLGRVAKKKEYLILANIKKRLRRAKEQRHRTEELCLEGQHPGVASCFLSLPVFDHSACFVTPLWTTDLCLP